MLHHKVHVLVPTKANIKYFHLSFIHLQDFIECLGTGNSVVKDGLYGGASLVAQWLRICLPMQGTRVRALVWEDPTCRGATRPVSHNY